ncbi:hypothetical protein DSO57_1010980, partial [Entomophthora muscae]
MALTAQFTTLLIVIYIYQQPCFPTASANIGLLLFLLLPCWIENKPLLCPIDSVLVTKVTSLKPRAGIELTPSCQTRRAGRRDLPAPGFASKSKNPGAGTIPALLAAAGSVLGPKSYAQALVGLAGPGQAIFSCPVNPDQAHPPLSNLGSPIGDPFFNQVLWAQESLSSQPKNGDQIRRTPISPESKPAKTNDQPIQDGPPKSQTTFPETPKNDYEAANQTAKPEMPSLATQIAPEECPEAPPC